MPKSEEVLPARDPADLEPDDVAARAEAPVAENPSNVRTTTPVTSTYDSGVRQADPGGPGGGAGGVVGEKNKVPPLAPPGQRSDADRIRDFERGGGDGPESRDP
jgi:hypothetical protein